MLAVDTVALETFVPIETTPLVEIVAVLICVARSVSVVIAAVDTSVAAYSDAVDITALLMAEVLIDAVERSP